MQYRNPITRTAITPEESPQETPQATQATPLKRLPKAKAKLENTTVRLTPEHKALIEDTGRSQSAVIRDALDQYFLIGEKPVRQADLGRIIKREIEKGLSAYQKKQALTPKGIGTEIY